MPLHQRIGGTMLYNKDIIGNDLQTIITHAMENMKHEMNGALIRRLLISPNWKGV